MQVGDSVTDPYGRKGIITNIEDKAYTVKYDNGDSVLWSLCELTPGKQQELPEHQPENQQDTHYKKEVQPIDLIDAFNLDFNAGNVIKYVARAKHKGNELDDLRKAKYYLDRLYEKAKASKS